MKRFKDFLAEARATILKNATPSQLKAWLENQPNKQARYVIDHKGRLFAGSARDYVHMDIVDHTPDGDEANLNGYIEKTKDGKFRHRVSYLAGRTFGHVGGPKMLGKNDEETKHGLRHPIFKKFAKAGIKRVRDPLSFEC